MVKLDRQAKRDAKWRAEWDARARNANLNDQHKQAQAECLAALRQIEAGHNDPRGLARECLARLDAVLAELNPTPGGEQPGSKE